jgi:DNA-binding transcriptional LysR family regulator
VLDRAAGLAGVTLQAAAEIDGVRLLATLALDGHGAAIVPATAVPRRAAGERPPARVPALPPRVVALAYQRRPPPNGAARTLFDVLKEAIGTLAEDQPGVRLGSAAFPLSRSG